MAENDGVRAGKRTNGGAVADAVSLAIIEQLQEDGRRPYAAIGKAVGLSEAAVRQRVQKLLDQGAIRIAAVTDPRGVGLLRQATVGITVEGDPVPVAEALAELAEVGSVVVTAGPFDLLAEIAVTDDEHLLRLLTQRVRTLPGVRSTESFVHLGRRERAGVWRPPPP
ncbi:Lrp/AsnC family transcriptional regulator [Streptomyces sp. TRM 70351]|nr:Lrp/AsnC family transcriptional regulator [Streptomyces sp. TRM 70351]MEE1931118.1 Lrp/AsnC family transcriptional regulator [Streptomyces sp. TRM 70351]